MQSIYILTVAVVLLLFAFVRATPVEDSVQGRIVGGTEASAGRFPYQASVQRGGAHICGGWIYSKRWIVTVAYWTHDHPASDFKIQVGTNTLSSGGALYSAIQRIEHPSYNPVGWANNIALLKTDTAINYIFGSVAPIAISPLWIWQDRWAITAGWGSTFVSQPLGY